MAGSPSPTNFKITAAPVAPMSTHTLITHKLSRPIWGVGEGGGEWCHCHRRLSVRPPLVSGGSAPPPPIFATFCRRPSTSDGKAFVRCGGAGGGKTNGATKYSPLPPHQQHTHFSLIPNFHRQNSTVGRFFRPSPHFISRNSVRTEHSVPPKGHHAITLTIICQFCVAWTGGGTFCRSVR